MKLLTQIRLVFLVAFIVILPLVGFGLPSVLTGIATTRMEKQAESFAIYLLKNLEAVLPAEIQGDTKARREAYRTRVGEEFERAALVATRSEGFLVDEILLIDKEYMAEVALPKVQVGQSYSSHPDIVANFREGNFVVGLEKHFVDGKEELDFDIVSFLKGADGFPRILEIKLNFRQTVALLKRQILPVTLASLAAAFAAIAGIMGILLFLLKKTAVDPAVLVAKSMEKVGEGDLDQEIGIVSRNEFGLMAKEFNSMVRGLRERFQLTKYVSKSTVEAVRTTIMGGGEFHLPERTRLCVFFSDVRGFTSYTERHDPGIVVGCLNRILGEQAKIIAAYGGDIDKFVGDETMAIFEDPRDALKAALEISSALALIRDEVDGLGVGMGLWEGQVVRGDIGSEQMKDFTVIGDTVNTAARLQALAKAGEILIPAEMAKRPEIAKAFTTAFKGKAKLKGKAEEMEVYAVTGLKEVVPAT